MSEDRDLLEVAQERGVHNYFQGDSKHLQLDIDQVRFRLDEELTDLLNQRMETEVLVVKSPSGGKHIYIKMDKAIPEAARIAMQAILGSDPKREMLSLLRHLRHESGEKTGRPAIVLFENDENAAKVSAFLKKSPNRLEWEE